MCQTRKLSCTPNNLWIQQKEQSSKTVEMCLYLGNYVCERSKIRT